MNMIKVPFFLAVLTASTLLQAGESGDNLAVGDMAPKFRATDQDGNKWKLADHLGEKFLVVYFYPAAMTGGCTTQACSYRDYQAAHSNTMFDVVGISGDTVQNLKYFQQAENLNFTLLADPKGKVAKAFGVPNTAGEKAITRTVNGQEVSLVRQSTTRRWTFIVSPDGEIVYKAENVKPQEDLEGVIAFLEKQKS